MILAIHGGMAVGKTTLLNNLKYKMPEMIILFEKISSVLEKVRDLDKDVYSDFIINQTLFLQHEIERFLSIEMESLAIMDYSIEEVIFHSVMFHKVYHPEWDTDLLDELIIKAKPYYVDRILFLSATTDVLTDRKQLDKTRNRKSFDYYLNGIHLYKERWFRELEHVDFLETSAMAAEEVLKYASEWVDKQRYGD